MTSNDEIMARLAEQDRALEEGRIRMEATDIEVKKIKDELEINTATTKRIEANTSTLVEVMTNFQGAWKVMDYIGRAARPMTYIVGLAGALAGLLYTIKGGGHK